VFKSARPASQDIPKMNVEKARDDLPVSHDTFWRKWYVKTIHLTPAATTFI